MMLHTVRAEAALEQIDNAAVFKLTGLHLKQIIGEGEQPETCIAQLAKRCQYLRVRWHGGKLLLELILVRIIYSDALRIRQHLHHSRADIRERHVAAGNS